MRVRVLTNYNDLQLNRLVKASEEFEVTDDRAKQLTAAKVAEVVTTPTAGKEVKGRGRKKKEE